VVHVSSPETGIELLQFQYSALCTMELEHVKDLEVKYFANREGDQIV